MLGACSLANNGCRYGTFGVPQPEGGSYLGPETNCTAFSGEMPGIANGLVFDFNNSGQTFRSKHFHFMV